jgi:formamidopyrimidine-DNA glycosylase
MIELPEAVVLAGQINETLAGKQIRQAIANQSPHKFAWYTGDPADYHGRLAGKTIGAATASAGEVEIQVNGMRLILSAALRYYGAAEKRPPKHQLLLEFEDGTALAATIQMWGCLFCVGEGEEVDFADYRLGRERPSPLSDAFDRSYFDHLVQKSSASCRPKPSWPPSSASLAWATAFCRTSSGRPGSTRGAKWRRCRARRLGRCMMP